MVYKHYSIYRLEVKVNFEFKKGVVITIKGNETSSWLAIWQTAITHQPPLPIYRYYMYLVKYNCSWVATSMHK